MVRRHGGGGFGIEGVGAGCTALLGCSALSCERGCVAVEALWLYASLDDEELERARRIGSSAEGAGCALESAGAEERRRVPLFVEFFHLPSFMSHAVLSLQ